MGHFTRSLNHRQFETRAGTRSRSRGWKGQRTNNAPSRSPRRSGHSILASAAFRPRAFDRNLIRGEHYGQRPSTECRINRPDTWQHRPALHYRQKIPCQQGAVHTWLKSGSAQMRGFATGVGSIADIGAPPKEHDTTVTHRHPLVSRGSNLSDVWGGRVWNTFPVPLHSSCISMTYGVHRGPVSRGRRDDGRAAVSGRRWV